MSKKQEVIDLRQRIPVRCTDKNPYAEYGKILEVHPIVAKEGLRLGHFEIVKKEKEKTL